MGFLLGLGYPSNISPIPPGAIPNRLVWVPIDVVSFFDDRARWTDDFEASTLSIQERSVRTNGKNSVAEATTSRISPNALVAPDGSEAIARLKGKMPWGDTASIAGSFVTSNDFSPPLRGGKDDEEGLL